MLQIAEAFFFALHVRLDAYAHVSTCGARDRNEHRTIKYLVVANTI